MTVDCTDDTFDQTVMIADGANQTITGIPLGTQCTVTETGTPPLTPGYSWQAPIYTPAQTVTVSSANSAVNVAVENPVVVFDLALRKVYASDNSSDGNTADGLVEPGNHVTFQIEVFNQGSQDAANIELIDFVDLTMWETFGNTTATLNTSGLTGGSVNLSYTWSATGSDGRASITGTLPAGQSLTLPVTLIVASAATGDLENYAEIARDDQDDVDSQPEDEESDQNGDTLVDNEILNAGGDEDDHDIAGVTISLPTFSLGNRVWLDMAAGGGTFNNGLQDGSEPGISGVLLQLTDENQFPVDLGSGPITTITDANGYYLFDDLPAGRYRVRIAPSNFAPGALLETFRSSTGVDPNINLDQDQRDDGIDNAARDLEGITSDVVELSRLAEPAGEADQGALGSGNAQDRNSNLTVDFGLIDEQAPIMALGNRVWRDQSSDANTNNGIQDPGEPGIGGVLVQLLGPLGQVLAQTTTDGNGFYLFENLPPGIYSLRIVPSNFEPGAVLEGLANSTPTELDPNADGDLNDNGLPTLDLAQSGVTSGPIALVLFQEPTGEADGSNTLDENANLTLDFGFFEPLSLGNRVFVDPNDNGLQDPGELGIGGVVLELFYSDGVSPVLDSSGSVRTQTTTAQGYYLFDELAPGSYVVHITGSNWSVGGALVGSVSSTGAETDPNADVDENDNGLDDQDLENRGLSSNPVALTYNVEPLGDEGSAGLARDANSNLTIDFGVVFPADDLYAIPTLGEWGLFGLSLLLLLLGLRAVRLGSA